MSHTTTVKDVRIHSITALRAAVEALKAEGVNISLEENASCRLWSQAPKMPLVVKVPGCRFDVGFKKADDGVGYVPVFDAHGGYLYNIIGQGREVAKTPEEFQLTNIARLMQGYTTAALQEAAYQQGGSVTMEQQADKSYIMLVH